MTDGEPTTIPASWLTDSVAALFVAGGLSESAASTVAGSLVDADMRGIASHGVMLVPMYLGRLRAGSISLYEEGEVVVDAGAVAVIDARDAFGQLSGDQAIGIAIEKARSYGVGAVGVRRAAHFGAASRYAIRAAEAGCIGLIAANTRPLMPAPGGARAVVGNNPLAVGVPGADGASVVLDMALSEAALGKIRLAAREGRGIPDTWATDAYGRPTTDPLAAIDGMLLPSGLHKGYGLALVLDIMTGVLTGGGFGSGVNGLYADFTVPNDCAHFFLALDVAAFGSLDGFRDRLALLADEVTSSPRAPGVDRIYLPGQIEAEREVSSAESGVPIDASALDALRVEAEVHGVDLGPPPLLNALADGS